MTSHAASRSSQGGLGSNPFLYGLLTAPLCAGFANLALSLLDLPKAFEDFRALLDPLAASVGIFFAVYLVLVLVIALPLRRVGLRDAPLAMATGTFLVLLAILGPALEVLQRDLSASHSPALWGLACAVFSSGAACAYLVTERLQRRPWSGALGTAFSVGATLIAVEVLALLWILGYEQAGASTGLRAATTAGFLAGMLATAWLCWKLSQAVRPMPILGVCFLAICVSPAAARIRATGATADAAEASTLPRPPCVVLITVDTLRPDMISGLNEDAAETPAIDSLLADSVVFDAARSAAPWTKPSLATIHTGLSPLVHGTNSRRVRLPEGVTTLAEYMRDGGYHTVGMGLNVHLEDLFNFGQGFREYFFPARGDYGVSVGAKLLSRLRPNEYPQLFPSTEAIADVAVDWIRANGDEPFFLWVHFLDPHWPYEPGPEFVQASPPTPHSRYFFGDHETVTNVQAGNTKLGEEDREWVRELYRGEIRYTDEHVGRILSALRELDLYDSSLIAFASDHGEEFWEHGLFEHGHTLYDEVLRVPLAFKLPQSAAKVRVDSIVSTESLTPTLVDLLDLTQGKDTGFTSPSLRGFWESPGEDSPEPIFGAATYYHGEKRAVFFDQKKLVLELDTGRIELFDLVKDPAEMHSLTSSSKADVERGLELIDARVKDCKALREKLGVAGEELDLSDEATRRLEALGYAGSDRPDDDV